MGGLASAVQAQGVAKSVHDQRKGRTRQEAQLRVQRSRLLSCRLTLRRRCSRPRSRRSSSSRALRMKGSSKYQVGPIANPETSSMALQQGTLGLLQNLEPSRAPTHIRSFWSRSRTSSSLWFTRDTSSSNRSCSRRCCATVFCHSKKETRSLSQEGAHPGPVLPPALAVPVRVSHLQWPAWPATRGLAAQTSAPGPAPRCCRRHM